MKIVRIHVCMCSIAPIPRIGYAKIQDYCMKVTLPHRMKKSLRLNLKVDENTHAKLNNLVIQAQQADEKANKTSVIESLIMCARIGNNSVKRIV